MKPGRRDKAPTVPPVGAGSGHSTYAGSASWVRAAANSLSDVRPLIGVRVAVMPLCPPLGRRRFGRIPGGPARDRNRAEWRGVQEWSNLCRRCFCVHRWSPWYVQEGEGNNDVSLLCAILTQCVASEEELCKHQSAARDDVQLTPWCASPVTSIQEAKGLIAGEQGSFLELVIQRRGRGEIKLRIARGTGKVDDGSSTAAGGTTNPDPTTWSVRELKQALTEAGVAHGFANEKSELVALAVENKVPPPGSKKAGGSDGGFFGGGSRPGTGRSGGFPGGIGGTKVCTRMLCFVVLSVRDGSCSDIVLQL